MTKPFLTQEQQLELLRDARGLIIDDEVIALKVLKSNNYYRLNAYFHQFMEGDKFILGTHLNTILQAYETDRILRRLLVEYLEKIEVKARCQVAHELGNEFGPKAFYDCSNFNNAVEWESIIASFTKSANRDLTDPVASHYFKEYDGVFEIWIVVEYLSFGELSRLFGITKKHIQSKIASNFEIHEVLLKSWLYALSTLRNVCAHYGYLRMRKFPILPAIPKSIKYLNISGRGLFPNIIALSWLLEKEDRANFVGRLLLLPLELDRFDFPDNWLECLNV
jgi:abortive infection bacteriophage resistance protein